MKQVTTGSHGWGEFKRAEFWYVFLFLLLYILFGVPVLRYLLILSYRGTPSGATALAVLVAAFLALGMSVRWAARDVKRVREERKQGAKPYMNWIPIVACILSLHIGLSACIAIAVNDAAGASMVSDRGLEAIRKGLFWFLP